MRTLMGNFDDSQKARYQHDKYKDQKIHDIVPGSWWNDVDLLYKSQLQQIQFLKPFIYQENFIVFYLCKHFMHMRFLLPILTSM